MVRLKSRGPRAQPSVIARALRRSRGTLVRAGAASAAINVLALTGSAYALQIYNRVLPARSAAALVLLTLVMLTFYAASGVLDALRAQLMGKAAVRLDADLSARVFALQQALALKGRRRGDGLQPLRDLDQIRAYLASAGPTALFDMPFMPFYLGAIFLLHPLLGALAVAGAVLLVGLMLCAEAGAAAPARAATEIAAKRWTLASDALRDAEAVHAMGLMPHLARRWSALNDRHLEAQARAAHLATSAAAAIKAARPALQSSMLGLGAYLALNGKASAGTMLAASIILARALAPVETAIAHWRSLAAARQSYARLVKLLAALPEDVRSQAPLDRPQRGLCVASLTLGPPGASTPVLRDIDFCLAAGTGLGVIGPSAAGKSTLARALVGVWQAQSGSVRLDGNAPSELAPEACGRAVGYLPQDVALFQGTIADNIARFDEHASEAAIVAAARAAGIEAMIECLPDGYRTNVSGGALSAGQRQRIALARALFREPFLVVLDEPDANLDAEGTRALTRSIASVRRRGGIVVVMAHRRAALAGLDQVLVLACGRVAAFGPREAVLASLLRSVSAAAE